MVEDMNSHSKVRDSKFLKNTTQRKTAKLQTISVLQKLPTHTLIRNVLTSGRPVNVHHLEQV